MNQIEFAGRIGRVLKKVIGGYGIRKISTLHDTGLQQRRMSHGRNIVA